MFGAWSLAWSCYRSRSQSQSEYELGLKNSIDDDEYYKILLEQKRNTLSNKENSIFNFDIFNIFKKRNDTTDALIASVYDNVDDDSDNNDNNDYDYDNIYSKIKNSTFDSSDTSNAISENNETELPDETNTNFKHYKYSKTLLKETEDTDKTEDTDETEDTDKTKTESEVKTSNIFNNFLNNFFN